MVSTLENLTMKSKMFHRQIEGFITPEVYKDDH